MTERGLDGQPLQQDSKNEEFLSAVSSFIRRCFEYADPDNAQGRSRDRAEDDLLDLSEDTAVAGDLTPTDVSRRPSLPPSSPADAKKVAANAALDPHSPVHITLPTFRMLVLADETLESFFESAFANSFYLADAPMPSPGLTLPSFLNLNSAAPSALAGPTASIPAISPGPPAAGVMAPGRGLRGMLDNIVTDGMRVAAEVRRRMDEAQKELDRGAVTRGTEDDDDDEGDEHGHDLLEGADAEAGASKADEAASGGLILPSAGPSGTVRSSSASVKSTGSEVEKSTMFER